MKRSSVWSQPSPPKIGSDSRYCQSHCMYCIHDLARPHHKKSRNTSDISCFQITQWLGVAEQCRRRAYLISHIRSVGSCNLSYGLTYDCNALPEYVMHRLRSSLLERQITGSCFWTAHTTCIRPQRQHFLSKESPISCHASLLWEDTSAKPKNFIYLTLKYGEADVSATYPAALPSCVLPRNEKLGKSLIM